MRPRTPLLPVQGRTSVASCRTLRLPSSKLATWALALVSAAIVLAEWSVVARRILAQPAGGGGASQLPGWAADLPGLDPQCANIQRIAVIGERHTGTNLAEWLLRDNLDPSIEIHGGLTAHKHWMQPDTANASLTCGTLVLLTVRNPWDWARALYGVCYCCLPMSKTTGFPDFVAATYEPQPLWDDADVTACKPDWNTTQQPPQPYPNVIRMRQAKAEHTLAWAARHSMPVEVVRLEDVQPHEGQLALMQRLITRYRLPLAPAEQSPGQLGRTLRGDDPGTASSESDSSSQQGMSSRGVSGRKGAHVNAPERRPLLARIAGRIRAGQQARTHLQPGTPNSRRTLGAATSTRLSGTSQTGEIGSSSSRSGSSPQDEAAGLHPLLREARGWLKQKFDFRAHQLKSFYLHPEQLRPVGVAAWRAWDWRLQVEAVSALVDPAFEARLGYHMLQLPPEGAEEGQQQQQQQQLPGWPRASRQEGAVQQDILADKSGEEPQKKVHWD